MAEDAIVSLQLIEPDAADAAELSADLATAKGNFVEAARFYDEAVVRRGQAANRELLERWSTSLLRAGRPYDAIDALQTRSERFNLDPRPRFELAGLAAAFGVVEEAVPALRWLIMHGHGEPEALMVLADPARVEPDVESCQKVLSIAGEDRRAEYGIAKADSLRHEWSKVADRLRPLVVRHPDFTPAQNLYGRSLLELGDDAKLTRWMASAPASATSSANRQLVIGRWQQRLGEHGPAARALWESLRMGGVHQAEIMTALVNSLSQLGRTQEVAAISDLLVKQVELRDALKVHLERGGESQMAAFGVADALQGLGRIWEAEGWARLAVALTDDKVAGVRQKYRAIRESLQRDTPIQLPAMEAASRIDLGDLAMPKFAGDLLEKADATELPRGKIRFADEASQRNWHHTAIEAPQSGGHTIERSVGGGVAIVDFDRDGWPDIAAAVLDGTALKNDSSPNQLCRNHSGTFVDVSVAAGYQDTGFGQGITVGDYNADGFPDILDANIGRNRLYRNNGDGTFADVSEEVGLTVSAWTTSVAMVDLDDDRIPEIFEVNYCGGREPYHKQCRNADGLGTCPPLLFKARRDEIWRGEPDGSYTLMTDDWMPSATPGRGLGVVAGQLDERPGIDVLVANDMTTNHLWSSRHLGLTQQAEDSFELSDLGVIRGLGTSGNSHSQASMGIAAGDADGDGDLDLFLTHFADDHNTYYEQIGPGLWKDRSYPLGFSESSMKYLGFGTQWADLDNQGGLELMIANGHVDRVDRREGHYRMLPQLYRRTTNGLWEEADRSSLGRYFETTHLGRAMATADVNRDGLCDVIITHLDDPSALLVNKSDDAGASVSLQLVATTTARDAIGSKINARLGQHTVSAQLTAGDGYMASNQRHLLIGCQQQQKLREVAIIWPSGSNETFGDLAAGREYLLIEGTGEAFVMSPR